MKIFEVASNSPDTQKLLGLSQFLLGRADDTTAKKEISIAAFIDLAKSLGVVVNEDTLGELINNPPLSNILEPLDPNSDVVRFKGNDNPVAGMSVDQAEQVVNSNAKAALNRRM